MSDRPSPELDRLLARIASRTSALRDINVHATAGDDERALLDDLATTAGLLRTSTTAVAASLAGILGVTEAAGTKTRGREKPGSGRTVDPLTRLAILRGTDKWGAHFYTPVYHELFQHLRDLPIRLLEIGIGGHDSPLAGGASLLMWADYFPHAQIVGIDVAQKRLPAHARVTILQGAQEDAGFLARVVDEHGPFDIVVDDGSHVPAHVRASFDALFPTLADGGFYVVEDVQAAFWPRFGGSPADGAETMMLARTALEAVNHAEITVADPEWRPPSIAPILRCVRAYHNLLVYQKGDNREPSTGRFDGGSLHVTAALAAMEEILAATPTAAGLAHLARTYSLAREGERAVKTLERGLSQWPDDLGLLAVGVKVARRWGNDALSAECRDRLARLAADDPSVHESLRKDANPKVAG